MRGIDKKLGSIPSDNNMVELQSLEAKLDIS
jgi:hypothetical protein